jgi:hypothetical protein
MSFTDSGYIVACKERERLIGLLDQAVTAYSRLDAQLVGSGSLRIQDRAYTMAREVVELARKEAERAREALMQHRHDHGC